MKRTNEKNEMQNVDNHKQGVNRPKETVMKTRLFLFVIALVAIFPATGFAAGAPCDMGAITDTPNPVSEISDNAGCEAVKVAVDWLGMNSSCSVEKFDKLNAAKARCDGADTDTDAEIPLSSAAPTPVSNGPDFGFCADFPVARYYILAEDAQKRVNFFDVTVPAAVQAYNFGKAKEEALGAISKFSGAGSNAFKRFVRLGNPEEVKAELEAWLSNFGLTRESPEAAWLGDVSAQKKAMLAMYQGIEEAKKPQRLRRFCDPLSEITDSQAILLHSCACLAEMPPSAQSFILARDMHHNRRRISDFSDLKAGQEVEVVMSDGSYFGLVGETTPEQLLVKVGDADTRAVLLADLGLNKAKIYAGPVRGSDGPSSEELLATNVGNKVKLNLTEGEPLEGELIRNDDGDYLIGETAVDPTMVASVMLVEERIVNVEVPGVGVGATIISRDSRGWLPPLTLSPYFGFHEGSGTDTRYGRDFNVASKGMEAGLELSVDGSAMLARYVSLVYGGGIFGGYRTTSFRDETAATGEFATSDGFTFGGFGRLGVNFAHWITVYGIAKGRLAPAGFDAGGGLELTGLSWFRVGVEATYGFAHNQSATGIPNGSAADFSGFSIGTKLGVAF